MDPELVRGLAKQRQGGHPHAPCLGGIRDVAGRWIKISDFAGGYTRNFARAVIEQAEKVLRKRKGRPPMSVSFVKMEQLPDEICVESDEELAAEVDLPSPTSLWGSPEPGDTLEAPPRDAAAGGLSTMQIDGGDVVKADDHSAEEANPDDEPLLPKSSRGTLLERLHLVHRRYGHPLNETLVRMLQLGGTSEEVLQQAGKLECATCAQRSPPP